MKLSLLLKKDTILTNFMNNHGGKRQNSGRRLRPETVTLSFRVPKEQATNLKKEIKEFIQRYELWRKLNG